MSAYKKKAHPKHREAEKSQLLFLHSSDVDVSGTHTLHVTFTHLIPDPQTRSHGVSGLEHKLKNSKQYVYGNFLWVGGFSWSSFRARSCSKAPLWARMMRFVGLL